MIITVANQKGGVGKSTIAMLLANWLVEHSCSPIILDADRQNTIYFQRDNDEKNFPEMEVPYPIIDFPLDQSQSDISTQLLNLEKDNPETYIIIDAPGNLNESGLVPCLLVAYMILCPFQYERKSLDSTGTFIVVLDRILKGKQVKPRMAFLPNRVRINTGTQAEKEVYKQVEAIFLQYGEVLPYIKDLQSIMRVNSFMLSKEQNNAVKDCFNKLLELCQK